MRFERAELDALADAVADRLLNRLPALLPSTTPEPPQWLSIAEAAAHFDVARHVVRDAIHAGELTAYKPGKSWRIDRAELERWASRRAREACTPSQN